MSISTISPQLQVQGLPGTSKLVFSKRATTTSFFASDADTYFGSFTSPTAPSYVGTVSVGQTGDGVLQLSLTSLSLQQNDLVVVIVGYGSQSDSYVSMVTSGYTELANLWGNDIFDTNLGVFYKVMGSTPDTTVQAAAVGSAGDSQAMIVHAWRNVDPNDPIEKIMALSDNNSAEPNPPAIITETENAAVLAIGAAGSGNGINTPTEGGDLSNYVSVAANSTRDIALAIGSIATTTPGPVDPLQFNFNDSANFSWAAATMSLKSKSSQYGAEYRLNPGVYGLVASSTSTASTLRVYESGGDTFHSISFTSSPVIMQYITIPQNSWHSEDRYNAININFVTGAISVDLFRVDG
jgi:hypothetical protein